MPPSVATDGRHRDAQTRCFAFGDRRGPSSHSHSNDGDLRQGGPPRFARPSPAVSRSARMKTLRQLLAEYLAMRHALGFKTDRHGWLLANFVGFLEARRRAVITSDLALHC